VNFQSGIRGPGCQSPVCVIDTQYDRSRNFHVRCDLKFLFLRYRNYCGCKRCPETYLSILVPQTRDFEFSDWDEVNQPTIRPNHTSPS
jgi:hypothetical protein